MQDDRKSLGKWGEEQSCSFLEADGYRILRRNYKCRIGEIDIIARKGEQLVFVEVKTRHSEYFESPKDAVTRKKQKFIIEAANAYIEKYNIDKDARFDIISIVIDSKVPTLEHIEEAFYSIIK